MKFKEGGLQALLMRFKVICDDYITHKFPLINPSITRSIFDILPSSSTLVLFINDKNFAWSPAAFSKMSLFDE